MALTQPAGRGKVALPKRIGTTQSPTSGPEAGHREPPWDSREKRARMVVPSTIRSSPAAQHSPRPPHPQVRSGIMSLTSDMAAGINK